MPLPLSLLSTVGITNVDLAAETLFDLVKKKIKWRYCKPEDLKPGDHIRVSRTLYIYEHHGIYIGNFRVIHFSGEPGHMDPSEAKIRVDWIGDFLQDDVNDLEVRDFEICDNAYRLPPEKIVQNARNHLKNQDFGEYDLFLNNCEHFATSCVFGKAFCEQLFDKEPEASWKSDDDVIKWVKEHRK